MCRSIVLRSFLSENHSAVSRNNHTRIAIARSVHTRVSLDHSSVHPFQRTTPVLSRSITTLGWLLLEDCHTLLRLNITTGWTLNVFCTSTTLVVAAFKSISPSPAALSVHPLTNIHVIFILLRMLRPFLF